MTVRFKTSTWWTGAVDMPITGSPFLMDTTAPATCAGGGDGGPTLFTPVPIIPAACITARCQVLKHTAGTDGQLILPTWTD